MNNYWDMYNKDFQDKKAQEKLLEELNAQNPGALPEDTASRLFPTPPPAESPYDVHISDNTVTMNGRPESLPSNPPSALPPEGSKPQWELEADAPAPAPVTPPVVESSDPVAKSDNRDKEMNAVLSTDNDKAAREAGMADLEKRRKRGIVPQVLAGIGDTISASASAFGGNAPGGSMQRMMDRQDKDLETGKKDIETKLRNDANSDISKQYQQLLGQFMKKDPSDPTILGLTANQIAEKIPAIEKIASMRQQDELTRLKLEENRLLKTQMAQQKADKSADELWTPMGQAKTKNDAKIVKDIYTSYEGSRTNLDELIDLRKSKGAELMDRKSVNRAKTIAADLTVQYKDLAKLGVLSKDDYRLLERLIPADPLQFDVMASTPASLDEARALLDRRIDAYAKGYGLNSPIKAANTEKSPASSANNQRKTKSGISYSLD